jgi:hypothetical protein
VVMVKGGKTKDLSSVKYLENDEKKKEVWGKLVLPTFDAFKWTCLCVFYTWWCGLQDQMEDKYF